MSKILPASSSGECLSPGSPRFVTVYVDDTRHPFAGTFMCHMWADLLDALLAMADCAGVTRKWLQKPPKAFWMHFDIAQSKRKFAVAAGAVETDRYGPLDHLARLARDQANLAQIARIRTSRGMSSRQSPLRRPPDPAIIAFAEELGRMLARREFARMEQSAERRQRDEEGDHGQSRDLRALLVRPAEPSLD